MTGVDERCSGEMRTLNKGKKNGGRTGLFVLVSLCSIGGSVVVVEWLMFGGGCG